MQLKGCGNRRNGVAIATPPYYRGTSFMNPVIKRKRTHMHTLDTEKPTLYPFFF